MENASTVLVKTAFQAKPGTYLVRMVARDTEAEAAAAYNGAVEVATPAAAQ